MEQQPCAPAPIVISDAVFRDAVSVVQEKDNFVTFLPHSTPATKKKQSGPKKAKFKEPIFVTESPQSYKKKKKAASSTAAPSNQSSADENSDDDMLLEDDMHHSNSSMKQMTSKERRQLRNKISARNFRVRRKEYITQLEEKVSDHEKTINDLKKENEKLRQANQDLMKQLLVQPITPPSSSGDELLSSSSPTSGSEGRPSPDAAPPAYQFQLNDLYDFNLFDQQAQQAQQQTPMPESSNLFYLNHATMPDWDMTQVLSDKARSISPQDYQRELSRELINDYPLLAPALMSIVLRHTLSLEYVTALAKEFSDKVGADLIGADHQAKTKHTEDDQETLAGLDMEDLKASFNTLKIEDKQEPTEEKPKLSELDVTKILLTKHYKHYVVYRARGFTHEEIMDRCRPFIKDGVECPTLMSRLKSKLAADQGRKEECSSSKGNNIQTLHAYCRVAGNLLRHPQRMTRVSDVLRKEIEFKENKHTARAESHYKSLLLGSSQKARIAN
ncbi:hypothetical protein FB192DRAFT_1422544 [Mucor lusitanicus]|nr:hypothetical protein FB192DRAFT_1422544 [Mucor lusitanicus]